MALLFINLIYLFLISFTSTFLYLSTLSVIEQENYRRSAEWLVEAAQFIPVIVDVKKVILKDNSAYIKLVCL